jgi:hypothetical protein
LIKIGTKALEGDGGPGSGLLDPVALVHDDRSPGHLVDVVDEVPGSLKGGEHYLAPSLHGYPAGTMIFYVG